MPESDNTQFIPREVLKARGTSYRTLQSVKIRVGCPVLVVESCHSWHCAHGDSRGRTEEMKIVLSSPHAKGLGTARSLGQAMPTLAWWPKAHRPLFTYMFVRKETAVSMDLLFFLTFTDH